MDFTAGYGIAGMTWIQLYFVCELGENIQVKVIRREEKSSPIIIWSMDPF